MPENTGRPLATGGGGENPQANAFSQSENTTHSRPCLQPRHGRVRGTTWTKQVRASVHMLKRPPAWALDLADLLAAERAGARLVLVREQERGIVYRAPIELVRSMGIPLDRGYGKQIALPLGHWIVDGQVQAEPDPLAAQEVLL